MSWAEDMKQQADYFVEKFRDQEDWLLPDHLEGNASWPHAEEDVRALFDDFARFADPKKALEGVSGQIQALRAAEKDVDRDFCDSALDGIELHLANWHGETAEGFRRYLRGPNGIGDALAHKRDRIKATRYALQAYERTISRFYDDVMEFIRKAQKGVEEGELIDKKVTISLVSAAFSVGTAAATAGAGGLAITLAVGEALTAGSAGANQTYLEGSSPEDIIGYMPSKGRPILDTARLNMEKVIAAFKVLPASLVDEKLPEVRPARPDLVTDDRFDPGGFHPDNNSGESGISREDVVKEPGRESRGVPGSTPNPERAEEDRQEREREAADRHRQEERDRDASRVRG
jgi:hypothetical protein